MRVKEALSQGSKLLNAFANPQKEAYMLLSAMLKKDRVWFALNEDFEFDESHFFSHVNRRKDGEPLEYILGEASFYSRDFIVQSGVLIPRPETEILVDVALNLIKDIPNPKVLEVGVGSGIISTMLALLRPTCRVVATDISLAALTNARANIKRFEVESRVELVQTSYFDGVSAEFDLLVSNPPYIADSEELELHVMNEPHTALFGGVRGDEMLCELLKRFKNSTIKMIACEMGYDQKESMSKKCDELGLKEVEFYKDLSGFDRGFSAKRG